MTSDPVATSPFRRATTEDVVRSENGCGMVVPSLSATDVSPFHPWRKCTVNACLILMSSAIVAGSDCGGCAAPAAACDPCAKVGLLDKIKARIGAIGHRSHSGCDAAPAHNACAPACGTPLFSGSLLARFKKNDCGCDPCAKPSLLDRLKARFAKSCDSGCDTGCSSGCGAAPAAPATPAAPKDMPKPMTDKKPEGKTTQRIAPSGITPVAGHNPF